MVQRVKAIFFDLGETLVTQNIEDNMITKTALERIARTLPGPVSPQTLFHQYMKTYKTNDRIRTEYNIEIPIQAWLPSLLRQVTGSEPSKRVVKDSIQTIVNARAANSVAFNDGQSTLAIISKVPRLKLGIISNVSSHDVALAILRKVRLGRFFDLVVTSALTGIRKPDPGIFRYSLYQLNLTPAEAVMVGDSERHDIQGGYNTGLRTVLISRKKPVEQTLADYCFKNIADAVPILGRL